MTSSASASLPLAQARILHLEQELAAAHASSQQLRALAYHTREGRLLLDAAGTVLLLNDQYCQLWDLPLPAAQWLGQPMSALVALALERVADPAAYAAELAQAQTAPISQLNARLALRNGHVLERDVLSVPLGETTGWLLCYRDATAQHLATEQLRRVSRIPEENPNPILRFDAAGKRVYANPAAHRYRQQLTEAAYEELRTRLARLATQALGRRQPQQAEMAAGPYQLQAFVVPVPDENYTNVYLVDITARHRAEQEQAEQRQFYETILNELPAEIFVTDAEARFRFVNRAAVPDADVRRWMLGHTPAETMARRGRPAEMVARHAAYFEQARASGQRVSWLEPVLTADGPGYVQRYLQPVPAADGPVHLLLGYGLDVTAREVARQEQAEQRAFYEAILHDLPAEVFVIDPQSRYRFLNPAAVPDAALREWMVGRTHAEYHAYRGLPDALAQERQARLDAVLTSGEPREWTETLGTAAAPRYVLRRLQPVPASGTGAVRLVIGYGLDVTAQETTRRELREQQEFTQSILDTSPSVIYVRDNQGQMLFENRAMQAVRTASRHLTGETVAPDSVEARELARFAANDQLVLRTGRELLVEESLTQTDGIRRVYQTVKRPLLRPDGTTQVLGVSTDITALKQAQYTLERSEKQYRDLMYYAQALICTYDMAGTALSVNPALAAVLNVPADELLGQPVATHLHGESRARFGEYLAHMATHDEAKGVSLVWPRGGQQVRHLLYHNFAVREPGQPPYIISHAQDITERVLAEQETQRARAEAEATSRARENFLANMSHEIRTPLNGVLGMAAQLAKTRLEPRQRDLVRVIRSSGNHLLTVLNDVLDMAKISSGKLELEHVAFDLCDAMGEALEPLAEQARAKGLAFAGTLLRESCAVPWVLGDPHRLAQVLLNLVSNAVKFTATGGITVRSEALVETDEQLLVRFSVTDTGPGIDPDKQAHIFESFTQAYADTARQHGGTGLGLPIARALVEQMNGTLTLTSTVGQGSTFAFALTLPKAPVEAIPTHDDPEPAYDTGQLRGARVLLVEDNETNRMVARMLLEPWGVALEETPNGQQALTWLANRPPYDLVLLDIQLPGLSGVDVAQCLRQLPDPHRAATPVIAVTANAFRADVERYLAAGFDDYLAKPYDEVELYRKMAALRRAAPAARPVYDLTTLRRQAQGREEFIGKIIHSFLEYAPETLVQLRAAAPDWEAVARLAHHIKPNLLALGVTQASEALHTLGRLHPATRPALDAAADLPTAEALHQALAHLLEVAERAVRELPAELTTPEAPAPDGR